MSLGIGIGFGELFAGRRSGTLELGEIFLEGTDGAWFGGARLTPFGPAGFGEAG
jgi:hypothetical protein